MKILHIGLCVDGKNEGLPYALRQASTEYYEINPGDPNLFNKVNSLPFDPDLTFCQIQSDKVQGGTTQQLFSKLKGFKVHWNGDMRNSTPEWHYTLGADLLLFSNMRDVENSRKKGLRSDFLQIGIDPEVFKKWESKESGNDIVFMANNYRSQFPESRAREVMVNYLKTTYGNRFSVFGNGWAGSNGENNADQIRQSKIYNNSKIGINFSQFNSDRYTSDRLFRILASGCFCLSHHYKGIEKDFKVGHHLDTFKDIGELRRKIDFYLTHDKARELIAQNGFEYCHKTFTYKQMVENLIKLYNES